MYTLGKHDSGHIGLKYNRNMHFSIGFESISHVRHVQYNINPVKYNLRLKLSDRNEEAKNKNKNKNKTNQNGYKQSVVSLNDFARLGKNVLIDTAAILTIDKKNTKQLTYQKAAAQELTYMIQLERLDERDFVLLPVISETNIVLPKSIQKENDNYIAFNSIAIYSWPESIEELKERLKNEMNNVNTM